MNSGHTPALAGHFRSQMKRLEKRELTNCFIQTKLQYREILERHMAVSGADMGVLRSENKPFQRQVMSDFRVLFKPDSVNLGANNSIQIIRHSLKSKLTK